MDGCAEHAGNHVLQAKVMFLEGIQEWNYANSIQAKVKSYEVDGWKACIDEVYNRFKMKDSGRYQVMFIRYLEAQGGKNHGSFDG
ncbi:Hypothetical protein LUCI_1889 [Lucifera butyrica]|uniref:Uncharacterized protein n=1 Tax=Lucifera butyrica TaxID=1351585 RepID=A0A498R933_9FIRM|nr:hypothetical protein [Lucifera butyrica]VBB06653.1 Hypothetical protein LUCI_1889 [Lucifera butyrica]